MTTGEIISVAGAVLAACALAVCWWCLRRSERALAEARAVSDDARVLADQSEEVLEGAQRERAAALDYYETGELQFARAEERFEAAVAQREENAEVMRKHAEMLARHRDDLDKMLEDGP